MKTRDELLELRDKLRERLAIETHRIGGPHDNDQLAKVAHVLAGIAAIDMVLDQGLEPPESDGPMVFFVG